jgi:hypothetical protein
MIALHHWRDNAPMPHGGGVDLPALMHHAKK